MPVTTLSPGFSDLWDTEHESRLPHGTGYPRIQAENDPMLFTGLMVALPNMMSSLEIGQLSSFITDPLPIRVRTSHEFDSTMAPVPGQDSEGRDGVRVEIHQRAAPLYRHTKTSGFTHIPRIDLPNTH